MQDTDWNDIRVFLAVARSGQINRAATRLKLDPTTIGRRLKRLESHLQLTLFERTREGHALTEAGERLLLKAEAMAEAAREIDDALGAQAGVAGNLRISVSEGFGSAFLTPYLGEFSRRHPELVIDLVASSGFLSPSKREADIAVMLSRPKAGPVLCKKLADYKLMLFASRAYLERHGTPSTTAKLQSGHRLISYVPDLLYAPELNYLDEFHPGLKAHIRSSSINAQARLIAEGAGIGVLPCFVGHATQGLIPVCPDHSIKRSFWLITHQDTQNLQRVRAGKEWLEASVIAGRKRLLPDRA